MSPHRPVSIDIWQETSVKSLQSGETENCAGMDPSVLFCQKVLNSLWNRMASSLTEELNPVLIKVTPKFQAV